MAEQQSRQQERSLEPHLLSTGLEDVDQGGSPSLNLRGWVGAGECLSLFSFHGKRRKPEQKVTPPPCE